MGLLTGVLLANLGTPDAPTTPALRRFLKEFLSDRRVIDLPRWKWWPILNFIVLPRRSPRSAEAYRRVWTDEGSPLLAIGHRQAAKLKAALDLPVALGMRYGNPSIASALAELEAENCRRILVLPLYPQYAGATTLSTMDAVHAILRGRRDPPEIAFVESYQDAPEYLTALANSVREVWSRDGEPERLLMSFHGIPVRYAEAGDPYPKHCEQTAKGLAQELGLANDRWLSSFQSRFGREEWLKPYTDETLEAWGTEKLKSVDVICPGFAADCLETLDEIDVENREVFEQAGGGRFRYIPALNDRDDHVAALAAVARRRLSG
ncbi:MAG: ferrochelatase [Planctomycetota bacterium]